MLMVESWVMCFNFKSNFAYCEIWTLFFFFFQICFCHLNNHQKGLEVVSVYVHVLDLFIISTFIPLHKILEVVDLFVN